MSVREHTPSVRRRLSGRARHHAERTRHHTRRAMPELRTLVKFGIVGGSGYLVNLVAFDIASHLGAHYLIAATVAFFAAVGNNFHWNRRWTFAAVGTEAIHRQARRFLIVSTISFFFSLGILDLLVRGGLNSLVSQAIAIACAMPFAFVANRVWTFAEPGALRRHVARRREARATRQAEALDPQT
jgi:dolichol-phosphate mannosyltransferase